VSTDPRDVLWLGSFNTLYDSIYGETIADNLIDRWQMVDEVTRALIAITASTSAVSGWALWSRPQFHNSWLMISGLAAFLAILHATLGVLGRIKDHAEDKRRFLILSGDLETFRYEMRVNPAFDVAEFSKRFIEFRKRYSEAAQLVKNDIAATRRLARVSQLQVNQRLASEIK
jgi:hypothetical protein